MIFGIGIELGNLGNLGNFFSDPFKTHKFNFKPSFL